jgi:hypothetical protein
MITMSTIYLNVRDARSARWRLSSSTAGMWRLDIDGNYERDLQASRKALGSRTRPIDACVAYQHEHLSSRRLSKLLRNKNIVNSGSRV